MANVSTCFQLLISVNTAIYLSFQNTSKNIFLTYPENPLSDNETVAHWAARIPQMSAPAWIMSPGSLE